ncbi:BMP family protein [Herpetosiphon sp. NSE202]|uniref:BMP family lipoprotein n=1 Tax=Herpetosiphon sp. NSE202 TaxID=3351349 RepID=UPI00362BF58A
MNKRIIAFMMLLVLMVPVLAACGTETAATTAPAATATSAEAAATATSAEAQPTAAPEATAAATTVATAEATTGGGATSEIKIGLVTDVGKVDDGTFNQFAFEGLKRAETELGVKIDYIETIDPKDYEKNIEQFASQGYDLIIGVGFLMGDAIKAAAAKYPDLKFAIVDFAYEPALANVKGLVFSEDESAFIGGALAAMVSKSGKIGAVGGKEQVPAVKKFVLGYEAGAKYVNPDIQVMTVYIDSFTDPTAGGEAAKTQIAEGADVIFGAGGQTGSGAIKTAADNDVFVIGVDQDEYNTTFKKGPAPKLITSAMKRVDNAVFEVVKEVVDGKFEGGVYFGNAANGGIDYAPFHDAESALPADAKAKLDEIKKGLADGSIKTGVTLN